MSDGTLLCRSEAMPAIGSTDLLVKLNVAGVCGTDLQIIQGLRKDPASVIGHEAIGEIVEFGKKFPRGMGYRVGDTVTFSPTNIYNQDRILGHSMDGVFQQHILLRHLDIAQGMLVKIEGAVPDWMGALVEPLASVLYAHDLVSQTLKIGSVAIFGAGTVGLLHALRLQLCGIKQIFLIHPNRGRLDWAVQNGFVELDSAVVSEDNSVEKILDKTQKRGVDVAFICTPRDVSLEALRKALHMVRPGGCIDLFGGFNPDDQLPELPKVDLTQVRRANFCGQPQSGNVKHVKTTSGQHFTLVGHRGVSSEHIQRSVNQLKAVPKQYSRLVTHVVSLHAASRILNQFRQDRIRRIHSREWVKLAIDCRRDDFFVSNNESHSSQSLREKNA